MADTDVSNPNYETPSGIRPFEKMFHGGAEGKLPQDQGRLREQIVAAAKIIDEFSFYSAQDVSTKNQFRSGSAVFRAHQENEMKSRIRAQSFLLLNRFKEKVLVDSLGPIFFTSNSSQHRASNLFYTYDIGCMITSKQPKTTLLPFRPKCVKYIKRTLKTKNQDIFDHDGTFLLENPRMIIRGYLCFKKMCV